VSSRVRVRQKKAATGENSPTRERVPAAARRSFPVAISALLPADSPRLAGESAEHIRTLADSDAELPPITVHRPTMRVIDGMHRLRATVLRGAETIDVRFIDDADGPDLFVLAVKANIAHGLPLTLADREAAAQRIVISHPQWSDRFIAAVTALAPRTVRAIRNRGGADIPQSASRIGQDGRIRPLNSAEGRKRASEILAANPDAPLRQVAENAGISLGTASDVRKRLLRGEGPMPARQREVRPGQRGSAPAEDPHAAPGRGSPPAIRRREGNRAAPQDPAEIMSKLMRDPVLRYSESGRSLLRRLSCLGGGILEWENNAQAVPLHCARPVADYARWAAESWMGFAQQLEQRERASAGQPGDVQPMRRP
jgi:hypothetical protein